MHFSRIFSEDAPDHHRKISIGKASFARERACARSAEDRAGARRGATRRRAAASSRPGIGARAESATARRGHARRVGTSGVRRRASHTAGRGQAGPRTGDGRAVVLLILGRRGATHSRWGRACWREEISSAWRGGDLSFPAFLFFIFA